jgi:uncharacterized protein (TIGR02186 family)
MARLRALAIAGLAGFGPCIPGVGTASAEELVLTTSTREVAITSTYSGADVTVFGIIERDARTISRPGGYDIVATVQGPRGDLVIQQKDQFGPIWLTAARKRYAKIPLFFSVLSSQPIDDIADADARQRLQLGLEYHLPAITAASAPREEEDRTFRDAAIRMQVASNAYLTDPRGVTMVRPNVFTALVRLPATAPVGLYVVNISVLAEGVPLRTAQAGFVVRKVGFDAFVSESARSEPFIYGIVTIAMAIFLGWLANLVFRRN